jgi:hypothetical protein
MSVRSEERKPCPVCGESQTQHGRPCKACDALMARLARVHGERYDSNRTAVRRRLRERQKQCSSS